MEKASEMIGRHSLIRFAPAWPGYPRLGLLDTTPMSLQQKNKNSWMARLKRAKTIEMSCAKFGFSRKP